MSREPMNEGTNQTGNTVEIEKSKASLAKNDAPMTLERVRAELKGTAGKKFWRSIDELNNTPEFQAAVEKEFPGAAQEWVDPVSLDVRNSPTSPSTRTSRRQKTSSSASRTTSRR